MTSSYKRLGDYIQLVDERNKSLEDLPLMGLSVSKVFFPTIANLVGTDMSTYKIVYKNQFTYIADTSRRGDKIAIALNDKFDKMLVSQAYTPFEVKDKSKLHPEYLMMWFRRTEFDRYARFKSHGSAREIFDWQEMCDVMLPIPSPEKQQQLVNEYHTLQKRIDLNNQLIAKLEEMAQRVYKQWFVEFEFPDENGKPYKSNGGKMAWCEELEKEIPDGWEIDEFQKITEVTSGKSLKSDIGYKYPVYGAGGITGYINDYLFNQPIIIIGRVGTHGKVFLEYGKSWPTDNTLVFIPNHLYYPYFILKDLNYDELNKGGVQALLTQTDLKQLKILIPSLLIIKFENTVKSIFDYIMKKEKENQKLEELKELLLGKMAKGN